MKLVLSEIYLLKLLFGYFYFCWILFSIQACFHLQAAFGLRGRYQVHDDVMTYQRPTSPIHAYVREEPVFDLVPFARPWRKMADRHFNSRVIDESLDLDLPKPRPVSVAPATIRTDEYFCGVWIKPLPHCAPPSSNAGYRERCCVVIAADVNPNARE